MRVMRTLPEDKSNDELAIVKEDTHTLDMTVIIMMIKRSSSGVDDNDNELLPLESSQCATEKCT